MAHTLDNPIYNSLNTQHQNISLGTDQVKYFPADISPLSGLKNNTPEELESLHSMVPNGTAVVLFTPAGINIPTHWKLLQETELLQMVYDEPVPPIDVPQPIIALDQQHAAQMLQLATLTKPGPFLINTIAFGNYIGIFSENNLIAMVGRRLQPPPYVEVSAVCTHPNHLGKGYASMLIREQVRSIMTEGKTPFLHVRKNNLTAISVYEKLGFKIRKELIVCALIKQ